MSTDLFKNQRFIDFILIPMALLLLILLVHYGIFIGQSFFVEPDPVNLFTLQSYNVDSNGWRSDLGLGISFMFGDPGAWHAWGIFRWFHQIFDDQIIAYNISILGMLWFVGMGQYFFLRKVVPDLGRVPSATLASLIIFNPGLYEFYYQRHWITLPIGAVAVSLILHDYLEKPRLRHYFFYTLTFFFALFLGSAGPLVQLVLFACLFLFVEIWFRVLFKGFPGLVLILKRFFLLNLMSMVTCLFLGAWVFYSVFIEQKMVGYVRDPNHIFPYFFSPIDIKFIFNQIFKYAHSGLLSPFSGQLGISHAVSIHSWSNVSPIFPIILVVTFFYKSNGFWEFAAKAIVLILMIFMELDLWVPGIVGIWQSIINLYPPIRFELVVYVYSIVLIAIFLVRALEGECVNLIRRHLIRIVAICLSLLYLSCIGFSTIVFHASDFLRSSLENGLFYFGIADNDKYFYLDLYSENLKLLQETLGWENVLFFIFSFLVVGIFIFPKLCDRILGLQNGKLFVGALLANSIFLCWAVYPLNKETLIWDRKNSEGISAKETLDPYDRFAKVGFPSCGSLSNIECIEKKYLKGEFGPRRYMMGYILRPALELTGYRSQTQKDVAEFIKTFMLIENTYTPRFLRDLSAGLSNYSSRLYDISAVKYLLANARLPEMEHIEQFFKGRQIYLYKNKNAWPYYYLADQVDTINGFKDLYEANKGTVYFWEKDSFDFSSIEITHNSNRFLKPTKLDSGDMEFQFNNEEKEFLVVLDAWHPNWRGEINGNETIVHKVNGVFKGVSLPSGEGVVRLYFDNKPYFIGVWISLGAWLFFLVAWMMASRFCRKVY